MKKAHTRLKRFNDKITWIKAYSDIAASKIPRDLDFVYIDGNHDYEFVKQDIALYYPKVRNGGVIGGHNFEGGFIGVVKAVMEFCEKNNLTFYGNKSDWWILKGENVTDI